MTQYDFLSEDEKRNIREAAIRGLEYHIYGLEQQLLIANAANVVDAVLIQNLEDSIVEKQNQINVLK